MLPPTASFLVSLDQQTILFLHAVKFDLTNDFTGAMIRYQLCKYVAEIILSLTSEEIQMLAEQSGRQNILRVANGNTPAFWTDLKQGLANRDKTSVNLSLVQSLMMGAPSAMAA